MLFGIPSEDFHGGFGIPEDELYVINYDDTDGEKDDYDPYTGKYAFCKPTAEELGFGEGHISESAEMSDEDKEFALAAQEAHDNMVRALLEAGAENHALVEDRNRLIGALKKAVEWLNYFISTEPDDIYHDEVSADTWAIECMLMDMEDTE